MRNDGNRSYEQAATRRMRSVAERQGNRRTGSFGGNASHDVNAIQSSFVCWIFGDSKLHFVNVLN